MDRASYPDTPGYVARDTSREAAEAIAPRAPNLRDRVLAHINYCPATCAEVTALMGLPHQTVSARFTELAHGKLIVDSGQRRKTASGRNAIVWRLAK